LNNGNIPLDEDEIKDFALRGIKLCFYEKIKKQLNISSDSRMNIRIEMFMGNASDIDADLIFGNEFFAYDDPDHHLYKELKEKCIRVETPRIPVLIALDTKLIKISIRNATVEVEQPDHKYIKHAVDSKSAMTINTHSINLDKDTATKYLRNSRRLIKVRMEMAVDCLADIVGGGVVFEPKKR
jgi:hypothetical protein